MLFSRELIDEITPECIIEDMMLWERKHSREQFQVIQNGDPYTVNSQYQQKPSIPGGSLFKDEYWRYYDVLPPDIVLARIYCDTAQKTAEHNDYTVFQYWVKSASKGIFLVDQVRGKWEAPQIESKLVSFWNKHKPTQLKSMGAQKVLVEDKSSGSSLIQLIKQDYFIPIEGIQRFRDKILRAYGTIAYFASGHVHLPRNAEWLHDYIDEFGKFSPLDTHKHDDQIDPTMDAVEDLLIFEQGLYSFESVG